MRRLLCLACLSLLVALVAGWASIPSVGAQTAAADLPIFDAYPRALAHR